MKKLMKRIGAVLMAVAMMAALSVSAWASSPNATTTKPSNSDTGLITATNIEEDCTVTAYQIVKATYQTDGDDLVGYEAVSGVTIAKPEEPTSTEVNAIAQAINAGTSTLTAIPMTGSGTTYTATVAPGYYVIIASGGTETIYNPMLAGLYYSVGGSDNTLKQSSITDATVAEVNASENWKLTTVDAWAKSSKPTIDKAIVDPGSENSNGDDTAIGDTMTFKVTTQIPAYSDEYTSVKYNIYDELSEGLDYVSTVTGPTTVTNIVLALGDTPTEYTPSNSAGSKTWTADITGRKLTITFDSDFALAHRGEKVTLTYQAKLNDDAHVNYDLNSNTATVEYTNNPADASDTTTQDDTTYHYTFEINGNVNGKVTTGVNYKNHELIKVDENGAPQETTWVSDTTYTTVQNALEGATFTLTNNATNKVYTATSNAQGYLVGFTGLDAGTYTLVETDAPTGYSVNNTPHEVVISATYNDDGTLNTYTITVDGTNDTTYSATYENDSVEITTIDNGTVDKTTFIPNTPISQLPSTGGIGTYVFTIVGVAIMAVAAGLLVVRHKKKAE